MLLASALSALCLSASSAQITLTNASFPALGDSLTYLVDESPLGINPATPPGGNQVWDFSALQADDELSVVFRNPAAGPNSANFPGADLVVIGQGETYYNVTNDRFEVMGYAGIDPANLGLQLSGVKFEPPLIERRSPTNFIDINFQNSYLGVSFGTNQPPLDSIFSGLPVDIDSMRVRVNTDRTEVADAYGTCQIPGGTYPVLRLKRTDYVTTSIDVYILLFPGFGQWVDLSTIIGGGGGGGGIGDFIGTDTTVTYRFMNDVVKEEIAVATMNSEQSEVELLRYKNNGTSPSFEPVLQFAGNIQAFPNPAVEWVRFDCTNIPAGEYTLKIFNIIGKCVWKKNYTLAGTTSFKVELDDFKKGTYIYSLVDKNGNAVGTKRLVVLKP